ncbi:carbohydrate ABC transporter permease [Aureibacillus halotolerans]|uniref:Carbohydrate ABC transporter membrane protein 1 (CUT1 family) n=1 Tax=Aureibacillus halotolerans TaxID=1508390 RepID=A0A4R6U480_9BACI|nr:sugar ABC transporter permease [Aureibacillus halotolerans]TDQ40911.1 carbohydrate ABC transporter membrane protein 1 (CUT1 family) [Aureibacillus halotolerans]
MKTLSGLKKDHYGYYFIAPFFIIFAIFGLYPMIYSFYLSLTQWDGLRDPVFVGLQNYGYILVDPIFYKALFNTMFIWIISVIPQLTVSLVLAVILNEAFLKGKNMFRAVFFFPNIVTAASLGLLVSLMFDWQAGSVNQILLQLGIVDDPINWKSDPWFMRLITSAILFWQYFGFSMIIYIAGLQGIPHEYNEAAQIDGASKIQTFFKLTIPLLKPVIIFQVITTLIGGVQIFDQPFTLSEGTGAPDRSILTSVMYLYQRAFVQYQYGYGAAIAFCLFIFIILLSVLSFWISTRSNRERKVK